MAGTAGCADLADDGENDVLCCYAGREVTINGDAHILGRLLDQGLGGQNMLDF